MIGLACAVLAGRVVSASTVEFDSLDERDGQPVRPKAHWLPAPRALPRAPAAVLLHGCGGLHARDGRLSERMLDYAALLHGLGMHALVVDSLAPRGQTELCTQALGRRAATQAHRRLDALAALAWFGRRADVDADRLGLIGWSNGASTVLAGSNLRHRQVSVHRSSLEFAVAFYPECEAELNRGYAPSARLLPLIGAADDWIPPCPDCNSRRRPPIRNRRSSPTPGHITASTVQPRYGCDAMCRVA